LPLTWSAKANPPQPHRTPSAKRAQNRTTPPLIETPGNFFSDASSGKDPNKKLVERPLKLKRQNSGKNRPIKNSGTFAADFFLRNIFKFLSTMQISSSCSGKTVHR
jgi:hypothetical protein